VLNLPVLYKPTKNGATQTIKVTVENEIVTVVFGQLGGKMQTKQTICEGKNLGRSNETTPKQQAELEARAKWEKKQKEGYSPTIQSTTSVNLPMKIHTYQDYSHKIVFPCIVSPKLNGVNAEYRLLPEPHILSRGGEQYQYVESRDAHIFKAMKHYGVNSLNGEIYQHGQHLQDIMSAVKKPSADKIQPTFWAFDAPLENGNYNDRIARASMCAPIVSKTIARSHEEIYDAHKFYLKSGYEGTIIRNIDGEYKYNTRSYDVLKLKDAQDDEFFIVDYNVDKNCHPVFICETKDKKQFKVKPKGTDSERKEILDNINNYMDKYFKVEFEAYSKDGVPLKPIGIGLRTCDENGEPKE
jgi:DNA ligase-1